MNFKKPLDKIKAFAFDVDGVLSDGSIVVLAKGEHIHPIHDYDAYALQSALQQGYPVAFISGGRSESIVQQLRKLGVKDLYMNSMTKVESFDDFCISHDLSAENILYMGDEMPDYSVLQKAGIACCPANAVRDIKAIADYESPLYAGEGCIGDVIAQVLKNHNTWTEPKNPPVYPNQSA